MTIVHTNGLVGDTVTVANNIAGRNISPEPGQIVVRKFGRNVGVGAGSFETVWERGGLYTFPTSAEPLRVVAGGNVNDASLGTGAHTIVVEFLDSSFNVVQETLTLAGASASASTSTSAIRLIRAWVSSTGTYHGTNAGDIDIEQDTSGIIMGKLATGLGQTELAVYTVPAGFVGYVTRIEVSVGDTNSAEIRLMQYQSADDVLTPYGGSERLLWSIEDFSGSADDHLDAYIEVPEKTDLYAIAKRVTGGGSAEVSFDMDLLLVAV
jgi:hypothetical protein